MTDTLTIRRRPDGSIDTGYFMAKGRVARSQAAWGVSTSMTQYARRLSATLAALLVLVWPQGGQG